MLGLADQTTCYPSLPRLANCVPPLVHIVRKDPTARRWRSGDSGSSRGVRWRSVVFHCVARCSVTCRSGWPSMRPTHQGGRSMIVRTSHDGLRGSPLAEVMIRCLWRSIPRPNAGQAHPNRAGAASASGGRRRVFHAAVGRSGRMMHPNCPADSRGRADLNSGHDPEIRRSRGRLLGGRHCDLICF